MHFNAQLLSKVILEEQTTKNDNLSYYSTAIKSPRKVRGSVRTCVNARAYVI